MATPVLIVGNSGTGKSTSMRNFQKGSVMVLNVLGKPLPFRARLDTLNNASYEQIGATLAQAQYKSYVIDDAGYLLTKEFMRTAKESGYQKFTDMALRYWNMITYIREKVPYDIIVYIIMHTETDEMGNTRPKTIGKLLDEKINFQGIFSIVLESRSDGKNFDFLTRTDGQSCAKSPMDMFETELIPNDLKLVDDTIRNFYGLNTTTEKEEEEQQ